MHMDATTVEYNAGLHTHIISEKRDSPEFCCISIREGKIETGNGQKTETAWCMVSDTTRLG